MAYIPLPDPDNFKISYTVHQIANILIKLDYIDALTGNNFIYESTEYIRNILNNK